MSRVNLSIAQARDLEHEALVERVEEILEAYDKPQVETQADLVARLHRTVDEMPEIYRWLLQLWSFCDHWTDFNLQQFGGKNLGYKRWRQRRDYFEKMASAAKLRYEGASRIVTMLGEFDPTGMPRQRKSIG